MSGKLLPIADAFRAIVRANASDRGHLHEISSYRWFHEWQTVDKDGNLARTADDKAAYEALETLRAQQASRKLRLRGTLGDAPPADIDPIDVYQGELDVFAGTLKVYASKETLRTSRTYANVHCYVDDLARPKAKGGRPPRLDRAAVEAEVMDLMDHHGEFSPDDADWNALARLYDALRQKFGLELANSTLEPYVKEPLANWRQSKRPSPKT